MDNLIKSVDNSGDWKSVSEPVLKNNVAQDDNEDINITNAKHRELNFLAPVLTLQLLFCLLILTFAFIAKNFMTDLFTNIKTFYDKEISSSMFFNGDFSDIDYSRFFGASDDEV